MSNVHAVSRTSWIAVDWGVSSLKVWAMDAENALLAERTLDTGLNGLSAELIESKLIGVIEEFLKSGEVTPVVCCGMVGARNGWVEAGFIATPCKPPLAEAFVKAPSNDPRVDVKILPGIKQTEPADVMRGEETQISGFLRLNPDFDGVLCMPGPHSKWVHISAGEIVSFQTFMTGELYAVLSRHSILRHSVAITGWDDAAFEAALGEAISRPEAVSAKMFSLHAEALLGGGSGETARARLSGLLIGLELAATRPYWLGQNIAIIGTAEVSEIYRKALSVQGLAAQIKDASEMAREGLTAAFAAVNQVSGLR